MEAAVPARRDATDLRRHVLLLIALVLVGTSCGGTRPATLRTNTVQCSGVIDQSSELLAGSRLGVVLDAVALPVDPLQLGRKGEPGTPFEGLRFAKFGLVVRADRTARIAITRVGAGRALLEWGVLAAPDVPTDIVEVGPCDRYGDDWVVFAGGLWVSEPTCVTLAVTSGGETVEVPLAVEAPCVDAAAGFRSTLGVDDERSLR